MPQIIPITNNCNQNCLFCSSGARSCPTNLKSLYSFFSKEKESIVISGGEPTLSKNLFKIIEFAKKKKLKIELQTNGINFSYFSLADKLVESEVDLFNINFPSHLSNLSDKITQTPGSFKRRMAGMENLQKLKANVRLTYVINSLNYKGMEKYVIFVKNNLSFIKYIQFSFIKILGNAKRNKWINPKYEAVQVPLLRALQKCKAEKIDFLIDHIPICFLPGFECFHADFIKLRDSQESVFSLREKIKLNQCFSCNLNISCYGVRKDYIDLFGKNIKLGLK
jgi:MoaA/NifB/PqqE/SkfB family radical SAM enzyme